MKLILISTAAAAGLLLGSLWAPSQAILIALMAIALVSAALSWKLKQPQFALALAVIAAMLFGAYRFESHKASLDKETLSQFNNTGEAQIEGIITTDPVAKGSFVDFRLDVVRMRTENGWQPAEGTAQAKARPGRALIQERTEPYFKYGDRVRLYGELQEPPQFEDFDYRQYLARQGVSSTVIAYTAELLETDQASFIRSIAYSVRSVLSGALDRSMPAPSPVETGLAKALTLGVRSEVAPKLNQAFTDSGAAHVLSVSGLHIAVLVSMMTLMLGKTLGKANRMYFAAPLIFLWAYALITGLSPPVVRSAVMGSLYIWALQSGRQRSGLIALAIAAAIMLTLDPNLPWDVSFQLSFVSMLGLFVLSPNLLALSNAIKQRFTVKDSRAGSIRQAQDMLSPAPTTLWPRQTASLLLDVVAINLSFMLASFPIIAFNFHNISLATLPASLLTIPALPLILPAVGLTAALGVIWTPLGYATGWIAWVGLKYLEAIVSAFGNAPFAKMDTGNLSVALVVAYYIFLACLVWALPKFIKDAREEPQFEENSPQFLRNAWVWCGAFLLTASVFAWNEALRGTGDRLYVRFLDTPGVNTVLFQKAKENTLMDGGSSPAALAEELSRYLSVTNNRIDTVFATQQTAQFVTGLSPVFSPYGVRNLLSSDAGKLSNVEFAFQSHAEDTGVKQYTVSSGASIIRYGTTINVLYPHEEPLIKTGADVANNSMVLRVTNGNFSMVFLRGLRQEGMVSLLASRPNLQSTALSVAWVNDRTMPGEELLRAVNPAVVVFTGASEDKRMEIRSAINATLPNAQVIFAPYERKSLISDGTRIWIK